MRRLLYNLLSFLLPHRCIICRDSLAEEQGLCPTCYTNVKFNNGPQCTICAEPFEIKGDTCQHCTASPPLFHQNKSVFVYEPHIARAILAFKNSGHTEYANTFAKLMAPLAKEIITPDTVIIPVPLHFWRQFSRGYNQSLLLAHKLALRLSIKQQLALHILKRQVNTPTQQSLTSAERQQNVADAFTIRHAHAHIVKDKHILLIDDVCTSGATLNACASPLLAAGAESVSCLTVAKVGLNPNILYN